jgi:hypothetical protein
MRLQAEEFLAAVPAYPRRRYHGRGVVIAGGGERFFPSLYVTIRALRHLGCGLPIQVWYLGRKREMPGDRRALLTPFDVECVDADSVRRRHPARRLGGWELKVFATLHSPFEEVLFLDADCYPCRNPEFLFELADYRARGAIFWPDLVTVDTRLEWSAFGVPDPRRLGSIESGQFCLDKRLSWRPLNLAWFYNDRSDYYYRYCHGDKHTFEVAWARCAQPFVMWEPEGRWVNVAFLHPGPDGLPLFVHRCRDKFRFKNHDYTTKQHHPLPLYYSSLPLERQCWQWLSELAGLTGRKLAREQTTRIQRPSRTPSNGQPRFAVATLYTPEIAALGVRTSKVLAAYARRHGYEAVIAKDRLDASRPPSWSKLLLIERYLTENPACTWLMWLDADAVIANPEQRLEDLVDESIDFLVTKDPSPSAINSGAFLVRNCPAALDMLRRAYAKVQYTYYPSCEQPALAEAMRECAPALRSRVVSRRLFNSFADEYRPGDFIVHFAGQSLGEKLAGLVGAIAAMAQSGGSDLAKEDPKIQCVAKIRGNIATDSRNDEARTLNPGLTICLRSDAGCRSLRRLCRSWLDRTTTMVEIGCFSGESTEIFASRCAVVYAVDPWSEGYRRRVAAGCENDQIKEFFHQHPVPSMTEIERIFDARVANFKNVRKLRMTSHAAASLFAAASLDFVYIDGIHTYAAVRSDIERWLPRLKPGAMIGGHDFSASDWPGVVRAVIDTVGHPDAVYEDTSWIKRIDG